MPNPALEMKNNVVYLHRERWQYFEDRLPTEEGWYVLHGSSAGGDWVGMFELFDGSFTGEVDHPDPHPISWLRIPYPPSFETSETQGLTFS